MSVLVQLVDRQLTCALDAKPWISRTGFPSPSTSNAISTPSELKRGTTPPPFRAGESMLSAASHIGSQQGLHMALGSTPHFHNEMGVAAIDIGAKEFMCIGAMP